MGFRDSLGFSHFQSNFRQIIFTPPPKTFVDAMTDFASFWRGIQLDV